jgi:pimeloyl-ACP methyl ester carboxylesterase
VIKLDGIILLLLHMPLSSKKTAYTLNGDPNKPSVVLIHGIGLHRGIWQAYEPILSEHFQVLSYDLLGHNKTQADFTEISLSSLAYQLKDLLDELSINEAALIGFSLGGMINRRFAMDFPDRVSALGILNSPHQRSDEEQKNVEARAAKTMQEGIKSTLETTIQRWFTTDFCTHNPHYIEQVKGWLLANNLPAYAAARQVLATGVIELTQPQPAINKPTLIITCENDSGSTPAMSYAIAKEIKNSQVLIIPKLQHMGLCEQPTQFSELLLTFLKEEYK